MKSPKHIYDPNIRTPNHVIMKLLKFIRGVVFQESLRSSEILDQLVATLRKDWAINPWGVETWERGLWT